MNLLKQWLRQPKRFGVKATQHNEDGSPMFWGVWDYKNERWSKASAAWYAKKRYAKQTADILNGAGL